MARLIKTLRLVVGAVVRLFLEHEILLQMRPTRLWLVAVAHFQLETLARVGTEVNQELLRLEA